MKVLGPLNLVEIMENEAVHQKEEKARSERKAAVAAKVTIALGVRYGDLTPAQRAFVDEAQAREEGGLTNRWSGFHIPYQHRRPNLK